MQPAIRIENLGKRYRVNHAVGRGSYRTLRESLVSAAAAPFRRSRGGANGTSEDFWALKDVSFDVMPGEVVGIIGRNGAGKSTLLKVLSRITKPTTGTVTLNGRVASLLEVGTGFHPELTGRENIFLNGSILGMSRQEIVKKFDAIVDFSGVERFLDTPVKRYSSGMYVRLAFAVAAHLEPEILVVDEVLAVGDAQFQAKCMGKMGEVARQGRTVLFVSHNMAAVQALCSRAVVLNQGSLAVDTTAESGVATYLRMGVDDRGSCSFPVQGEDVALLRFIVDGGSSIPVSALKFRDPFTVELGVSVTRQFHDLHMLLILWRNNDGTRIASVTSRELRCGRLEPGESTFRFRVDPNPLLPGEYSWSVTFKDGNVATPLEVENIAKLSISEGIIEGASHPYTWRHGTTHLCDELTRK